MRINNTANLFGASKKIHAAIALYGNTAAAKLEAQAKANAPWVDRTSNARNSIQGKFNYSIGNARVTVSGNVDYFVFLEYANERRYAILEPTMQSMSAEILKGYQAVIR